MRRLAGALLALALAAAPAHGVWNGLTEDQVKAALAHGKTSYDQWRAEGRPLDDLDPEYIVDLGPDVGRAMLFTEFAALALEARRWQAIARTLKPTDIEDVLRPLRGRLSFSVVVHTASRDALRESTAKLIQADTSHEPASRDIHRGTPQVGAPNRFVNMGRFTFDVQPVNLSAPATLAIIAKDGQEIRFSFDLAHLR